MIKNISIENFKSVQDLKLELGRVTVLIGENGSGKSNILEAVAMLGAAAADKLDNEFLVTRGIRVTDTSLMVSAFAKQDDAKQIERIKLGATSTSKQMFALSLVPATGKWSTLPGFNVKVEVEVGDSEEIKLGGAPTIDTPKALLEEIARKLANPKFEKTENGFKITIEDIMGKSELSEEATKRLAASVAKQLSADFYRWNRDRAEEDLHCSRFLIYAPENSALRRFEEEGQIQPVGIRGEGLFKMLQAFASSEGSESLAELKRSLELVGWFFDFSISPNLAPGESRLKINDRFLGPDVPFDQRSANEGFLFLIFYFSVFLSKATPQFFAIDNIDAALNPKLCGELMRRLCDLAKKYDKQVILTTHNPAILDGINLSDDEQRLYSVYRNDQGHTKVRRIQAPKVRSGMTPTKLSDAFMNGLIGGLPKNF
jgi:predicted ATPase